MIAKKMLSSNITTDKQGCFGSVFCNDSKNEVCARCSLFAPCNIKARESLGKTKTEQAFKRRLEIGAVDMGMDVKIETQTTSKSKSIPKPIQKILENEEISTKARMLIKQLYLSGLTKETIISSIKSGNNPITLKPESMFLACELLIRTKELNRDALKTLLIKRGMTSATASSRASYTIEAIKELGIYKEKAK